MFPVQDLISNGMINLPDSRQTMLLKTHKWGIPSTQWGDAYCVDMITLWIVFHSYIEL